MKSFQILMFTAMSTLAGFVVGTNAAELSGKLPNVRIALRVINNTHRNLLLLENDINILERISDLHKIGAVRKKNKTHVSAVDLPYNRAFDEFATFIQIVDPEAPKNENVLAILKLQLMKLGDTVTLWANLGKKVLDKLVPVDKENIERDLSQGPITFLVTLRFKEDINASEIEITTSQELPVTQRL